MTSKFKKILARNQSGYDHEPVYEYRGFKLQNSSCCGSYGCWRGIGYDPEGEVVKFTWLNTRAQVDDEIYSYFFERK